jgi:transcription antitermination factor NusG
MIVEAQPENFLLSSLSQVDCCNWYVIQIGLGKERYVKELIDQVFKKEVKTLFFTRKIIHKKNNNYEKLFTPLFPGYLFVHKHVNEVEHLLRSRLFSIYFKTVSFGNGPVKVGKDEMELLLTHCDESGAFDLSHGIKEGEKIVISAGPPFRATLFSSTRKRRKRK